MKAGHKVVTVASTVLVLALGLLHSGRSVSAASPGQITGTVSLTAQLPTKGELICQRIRVAPQLTRISRPRWKAWLLVRMEGWPTSSFM